MRIDAFETRDVGSTAPPIEPAAVRSPSPGRAAIAVFVDTVDAPWLKFLPRGFRHCLAVIEDGSSWLLCDPMKDRMDLRLLDLPPGFDLARHYAEQGHNVLVGQVAENLPRQGFALAPLTCVAVVKRLLGVRAARVLTPYQLFRHLLDAHPVPFVQCSAAGATSPDLSDAAHLAPSFSPARA